MKRLVVFDLDGTLAESKSPVDVEMAGLLGGLLSVVKVAVISGGDWPQFETQLLSRLAAKGLENLSLLPACGTKFYRRGSGWEKLYAEDLEDGAKRRILAALRRAARAPGLGIGRIWGDQIEDRGSQITFSALGQRAPLEAKRGWDPDFAKRKAMKAALEELLPDHTVRLGGSTSIDVTRAGVDKAYGLGKLREVLGVGFHEMLFIGDALFPGGNDYPVKDAGAASIQVRDPEESKRIIEAVTECLRDAAPIPGRLQVS